MSSLPFPICYANFVSELVLTSCPQIIMCSESWWLVFCAPRAAFSLQFAEPLQLWGCWSPPQWSFSEDAARAALMRMLLVECPYPSPPHPGCSTRYFRCWDRLLFGMCWRKSVGWRFYLKKILAHVVAYIIRDFVVPYSYMCNAHNLYELIALCMLLVCLQILLIVLFLQQNSYLKTCWFSLDVPRCGSTLRQWGFYPHRQYRHPRSHGWPLCRRVCAYRATGKTHPWSKLQPPWISACIGTVDKNRDHFFQKKNKLDFQFPVIHFWRLKEILLNVFS